jgi:hypothetical protein
VRWSVPPGAVHWEQIESLQDASEANIAPILTLFRQQANVEGLIDRGFLPSVPSPAQPLDLQIVVIYDLTDRDEAVASQLLQTLESSIRNSLSAKANASLRLIVIGDLVPDLGKQTTYWPRFRLYTTTYGGMEATRARVLEACQTLLVTLITSEILEDMEKKIGLKEESVSWIWMGASALVVDLTGMREFVRLSILQQLIEPLIREELDVVDRQSEEPEIQRHVGELQTANLAFAVTQLRSLGWDARSEGREIARMQLKSGGELEKNVLKPMGDLAEFLCNYYKLLRNVLGDNLADEETKQFDQLREYFEFAMDPRRYDYQVLGDHKDAPLSLKKPRRPGLALVTFAVEMTADYLKKSADAIYKDLKPHRIGSGNYLSALAAANASNVLGEYLRFLRFERSILSPLGFLLKLIPAWPLLTAVIVVFTEWDELCAAIVAALLLSGLATLEFIGLQEALRRDWRETKNRIEDVIRSSTFGVFAKLLRDYRLLVAGRLEEMAFSLRNLLVLLNQVCLTNKKQIAECQVRSSVLSRDQAAVCWLSDWDACHQSIDQARKLDRGVDLRFGHRTTAMRNYVNLAVPTMPLLVADKRGAAETKIIALDRASPRDFNSSIAKIIAEQVLVRRQQLSLYSIFDEIACRAEWLTNEYFLESGLKAHALAEKEELLKCGRRWEWLYQRAQPLGGTADSRSFVIFTGENDAAYGATTSGTNSPYWSPDYRIVRSRQTHEICCVRGVPEWK